MWCRGSCADIEATISTTKGRVWGEGSCADIRVEISTTEGRVWCRGSCADIEQEKGNTGSNGHSPETSRVREHPITEGVWLRQLASVMRVGKKKNIRLNVVGWGASLRMGCRSLRPGMTGVVCDVDYPLECECGKWNELPGG